MTDFLKHTANENPDMINFKLYITNYKNWLPAYNQAKKIANARQTIQQTVNEDWLLVVGRKAAGELWNASPRGASDNILMAQDKVYMSSIQEYIQFKEDTSRI